MAKPSVCLSVCSFIYHLSHKVHKASTSKGVPYVLSPAKNSPVKVMVVAGAYSLYP